MLTSFLLQSNDTIPNHSMYAAHKEEDKRARNS